MKDDGTEVDLIKDGKNIRITNKTRKIYANKVTRFYLLKEVNTETKEFLKGFYQVIPKNFVTVFDPDELEFIMSGTPEISV